MCNIENKSCNRYKRYEKYKDSSVEWIREIPYGWKVSKLYNYLNKITDGSHTSVEIQLTGKPYVTVTDIYEDKEFIDTIECKKISEEDYEMLIRMGCKPKLGDILFSQIGTIGLAVEVRDMDDFVMLSSLAILTPDKRFVYTRYLIYVLRSKFIGEQWNKFMAGGAVKRITLNHIKNFKVLIPEISEQKQIANFLDKKTSKIDSLIDDKKKLITLLEEKRQAIITEAVTKGLNPNVKMKNSGVEWIGKIPEHWKVAKLKYTLLSGKDGIKIGPFGSSLKLDEMNEEFTYKVYGQENIINDDFSLGKRFIDQEKFELMKSYELNYGDIIISMMGTIGKCKVVPKEIIQGIMDSHLIRLKTNREELIPDYLELLIGESKYIYNQLFLESKGSIMNGLNSTIIKNLILALPDKYEQEKILFFINEYKIKINAIVNDTKIQIEKLKEYRKSLILEAVTGKIDVRDYCKEA